MANTLPQDKVQSVKNGVDKWVAGMKEDDLRIVRHHISSVIEIRDLPHLSNRTPGDVSN